MLWGEGVLLTTCPRGGGGGNVLGIKAYLIHSGACPGGQGGSVSMFVVGGGGV